jgi:hypothetical protein
MIVKLLSRENLIAIKFWRLTPAIPPPGMARLCNAQAGL